MFFEKSCCAPAPEEIEARVDGRPLPAGQMLVGRGTPYPGGGLNPAALTAEDLPAAKGAALLLWLPGGRRAPPRKAQNPETQRRRRARGDIQ